MSRIKNTAGRVPVSQGSIMIRFTPALDATAQNIATIQDAGVTGHPVKLLMNQFKADVHSNMCRSYSPSREAAVIREFGSQKLMVLPNYQHTLCASGTRGNLYRGAQCLECPLFNADNHPRHEEVAAVKAADVSDFGNPRPVWGIVVPNDIPVDEFVAMMDELVAVEAAKPFIPIPEWW